MSLQFVLFIENTKEHTHTHTRTPPPLHAPFPRPASPPEPRSQEGLARGRVPILALRALAWAPVPPGTARLRPDRWGKGAGRPRRRTPAQPREWASSRGQGQAAVSSARPPARWRRCPRAPRARLRAPGPRAPRASPRSCLCALRAPPASHLHRSLGTSRPTAPAAPRPRASSRCLRSRSRSRTRAQRRDRGAHAGPPASLS